MDEGGVHWEEVREVEMCRPTSKSDDESWKFHLGFHELFCDDEDEIEDADGSSSLRCSFSSSRNFPVKARFTSSGTAASNSNLTTISRAWMRRMA